MWRLTTTIVALDGSACFWTQPLGREFVWTLAVERGESQVRFLYDVRNAHDNLLFVGTMQGRAFSAASATWRTWWACAGGVAFSSSVDGSFAPDDTVVTGRERLHYQADSGPHVTITFAWHATRM